MHVSCDVYIHKERLTWLLSGTADYLSSCQCLHSLAAEPVQTIPHRHGRLCILTCSYSSRLLHRTTVILYTCKMYDLSEFETLIFFTVSLALLSDSPILWNSSSMSIKIHAWFQSRYIAHAHMLTVVRTVIRKALYIGIIL